MARLLIYDAYENKVYTYNSLNAMSFRRILSKARLRNHRKILLLR